MWLHDWLVLREFPEGLEEYCCRCGKVRLFTHKESSDIFLSYHLRMSLNPRMIEYYIEYPKAI